MAAAASVKQLVDVRRSISSFGAAVVCPSVARLLRLDLIGRMALIGRHVPLTAGLGQSRTLAAGSPTL